MPNNFPAYNLISWRASQGENLDEYMKEYMDAQPRMMPCFEKHAEAETAFFREVGLMCSCESVKIDYDPKHCAACGRLFFREDVLAAEVTVTVPDGVRQVATRKKGKG